MLFMLWCPYGVPPSLPPSQSNEQGTLDMNIADETTRGRARGSTVPHCEPDPYSEEHSDEGEHYKFSLLLEDAFLDE